MSFSRDLVRGTLSCLIRALRAGHLNMAPHTAINEGAILDVLVHLHERESSDAHVKHKPAVTGRQVQAVAQEEIFWCMAYKEAYTSSTGDRVDWSVHQADRALSAFRERFRSRPESTTCKPVAPEGKIIKERDYPG